MMLAAVILLGFLFVTGFSISGHLAKISQALDLMNRNYKDTLDGEDE